MSAARSSPVHPAHRRKHPVRDRRERERVPSAAGDVTSRSREKASVVWRSSRTPPDLVRRSLRRQDPFRENVNSRYRAVTVNDT